ncbi:hypothetical protein J5S76_00480 [Bacillus amyloliquefaciens]|nr:hypothetical protein [Bacillus amyloliquefaciens]
MPDIASITTAIESVKLALGIAKDLKTAGEAFTDAENRLKLSDLYFSLSEARISLADAQEEIHSLQKQIYELQKKIESSDELEFKDGVYYRQIPIPGKPNGPFCPGCYESPSRRMASLSPMPADFTFAGRFTCNSCGKTIS